MTKLQQRATGTASSAQQAFDVANEAKNRSMGEMSRVDSLVERISNFTVTDKASPDDVIDVAEEVRRLKSRVAFYSSNMLSIITSVAPFAVQIGPDGVDGSGDPPARTGN